MRGSRGGTGGPDSTPSPENHKAIGFLSNTGPDPLGDHKGTKLAFSVYVPSAQAKCSILFQFIFMPNKSRFGRKARTFA